MQLASSGDNLLKMSSHVSWEKKKNTSKCHLLKILPRVLSINKIIECAKIIYHTIITLSAVDSRYLDLAYRE